jgi:hypothetical protein
MYQDMFSNINTTSYQFYYNLTSLATEVQSTTIQRKTNTHVLTIPVLILSGNKECKCEAHFSQYLFSVTASSIRLVCMKLTTHSFSAVVQL